VRLLSGLLMAGACLATATEAAPPAWYLLSPPLALDLSRALIETPISRWHLVRAFDTAAECNKERLGAIAAVSREVETRPQDKVLVLLLAAARQARCVASGTVRLEP